MNEKAIRALVETGVFKNDLIGADDAVIQVNIFTPDVAFVDVYCPLVD